MKIHANNRQLAEHLLETAFAILRNAGQEPVDAMALSYGLLADGIDVSPNQQAELHHYLRQVLADFDDRFSASPAGPERRARADSRGGVK